MYVTLTTWWALVGVVRTCGLLLAWWHVPDLHKLERQAAADALLSDHLRIHRAGRDVRTARGLILAGCAVVVVAALVTLSQAPAWAWVLLGLVALPLLAAPGGPRTSRSSPPPPSRLPYSPVPGGHHPRTRQPRYRRDRPVAT
jgi:hypothetical protein